MFLEKYNFIVIEKKLSNFNGNIEIYSDDPYNEDSDEEYPDGKIQIKQIKCKNPFLEKNFKNDKFNFKTNFLSLGLYSSLLKCKKNIRAFQAWG